MLPVIKSSFFNLDFAGFVEGIYFFFQICNAFPKTTIISAMLNIPHKVQYDINYLFRIIFFEQYFLVPFAARLDAFLSNL